MYVYILFLFAIYLNIVYVMYVPMQDRIYLTWADNLCSAILQRPNPEFLVARQHILGKFSSQYHDFNLTHCDVDATGQFEFLYRPIFGDHIHIGYSLFVNGRQHIMRDHNMSHNVPYETKPSCSNAPPYAYVKKYYHTGVHTHCDQIIHVHPFSAPRELRVEGRKANLGMWFENVGIFYHPQYDMFEIPDIGMVKLKMAYYVHVNDKFPSFVTQDAIEIQNLWLVDHQAFVALYDDERAPKNKKVLLYKKSINYPKRFNKRYSSFYVHQFETLFPYDLLLIQRHCTVSWLSKNVEHPSFFSSRQHERLLLVFSFA